MGCPPGMEDGLYHQMRKVEGSDHMVKEGLILGMINGR